MAGERLLDQVSRTSYYNDSGEEIPANAVIAIKDEHTIDTRSIVFNVKKPSGAQDVSYSINFPVATPTKGIGSASSSYGRRVLFDDADTPAAGEEWGPQNGSWKLHKGGSGFTILGGVEGTGDKATVRVKVSAGSGATGVGLVVETITAAAFDTDEDELTYGKGKIQSFSPKVPPLGATPEEILAAMDIDVLDTTVSIDIFTLAEESTPADKIVAWHAINGRRLLIVEPCQGVTT